MKGQVIRIFITRALLGILCFLLSSNTINSQISTSHLYLYDEFDNFSISKHIETISQIDNKVAQYIFDQNKSLLRKIAIVDQIIEKGIDTRKARLLLDHYQSEQSIAESKEITLIKNFLVADIGIKRSYLLVKGLDFTKSNLVAFLAYKYLEVNYYESIEESDLQLCSIHKEIVNTYKNSYTEFENSNVKELFYDILLDYDYTCSDEDLIMIKPLNRKKYINKSPKVKRNEFKLKAESGVYKIPIKINDAIIIDFVYDSGASDLLIPLDVFKTLVRMGKIGPSDLRETKYYTIADGSTIESQTFILKSLKLGSIEIKNVLASVGPIESDLLLGQSFQKRFKEIRIDNRSSTLIVIE